MRIITLTLNPAFDMHCTTQSFRLGHESFFEVNSFEAGGKGINISRALLNNEVDNTAIVVIGNENSSEFCAKLDKDGINYIPIFIDGRIRENIILHDNSNIETRVSFNGFNADKELLDAVKGCIDDVDSKTIVTVTGSNPNGLNISEMKKFVSDLKNKGALVIIDSRSFSLQDLIDVKPFLIKPNKDELEKYIGKENLKEEEILSIAKDLDAFCKENDIRYYLMGGSALVPMRHKGFIPWDDDLDVAMTRKEWNSFVSKFEESELNKKYELDAYEYKGCDPKFVLCKLCLKDSVHVQIEEMAFPNHKNIYIDIFIIDNVSDNSLMRKFDSFVCDNIRFISNSVGAYRYKNDFMKQVMNSTWKTSLFYNFRLFQGFICSFASHRTWCRWFHQYASRHNDKYTKLTTVAMGLKRYNGETLERDIWFPYSQGTFEGVTVNLPCKVKDYLTRIYGDYMKLPPVEDRGVHPIVKLSFPK